MRAVLRPSYPFAATLIPRILRYCLKLLVHQHPVGGITLIVVINRVTHDALSDYLVRPASCLKVCFHVAPFKSATKPPRFIAREPSPTFPFRRERVGGET